MKKETEESKKLKHFIHESMKTVEGRLFLNTILATCGVFKPINTTDVQAIMFEEGKKSVGFQFINLINEENKNNLSILMQGE